MNKLRPYYGCRTMKCLYCKKWYSYMEGYSSHIFCSDRCMMKHFVDITNKNPLKSFVKS